MIAYARQLISCYILLSITLVVNAQTHLPDSMHLLLDEVVIRNNAIHKIVSPTPSQILNGKKLASLNSFSVADAVRYFSGVQLKDYGGIGGLKTINVRSMGTQHVAVLFDGINLGNAQNGTVDLGKFSLDNIEGIELYNGQKNSLLQPARAYLASSSMFLKTKVPHFDSSQKHMVRSVFKTGSFGLVNPSVLWHQKLDKHWSLMANTEYILSHGRYKYRDHKKGQSGSYDTTAVRHNGDLEAFRAETAVFYKNRKSDGFVKGYLYSSERGLPGAVVANNYYNPQRLWDKNAFIQGSYKFAADSNYSILFNAKYAYDYTKYLNPDMIIREDRQLTNHYHQTEIFASVAQQYTVKPWWEVGLSTDINYNSLNADLDRFVYPRRYSYIGVLSNNLIWDRLLLQSSLLYCYYDEHVKYYQTSADRRALLPYLGASWQPTVYKGFRLRAFYKESLRMPTFNDLYYTDIGNIRLNPEYSKQINLGFIFHKDRSSTERFSVQSDFYYNRIKDKIIATPTRSMFRWMMVNQGLVMIKGMDVSADYNRLLWGNINVQVGMTYTYQKALDKTPGGDYFNHLIPYTPVHSGTLYGSVQWRNWSLNYSYIYTGERYVLPQNTLMNYMQPWYTTDIGLVWDKKIRHKQYRVAVEVNNIFNQYYDVVLNYPMPGTNIRTTLSITL